MARARLKKHQPATSTITIAGNFETGVLGMLTLACACGILGLDVPEQKKGNLKLLLKYISRHFSSEDADSSDDGGSSWYAKLHNHLKVSFSKKVIHLLVSKKNLNSLEMACLTETSFPRISFGETRQLCR